MAASAHMPAFEPPRNVPEAFHTPRNEGLLLPAPTPALILLVLLRVPPDGVFWVEGGTR